jgi:hypothetical protein
VLQTKESPSPDILRSNSTQDFANSAIVNKFVNRQLAEKRRYNNRFRVPAQFFLFHGEEVVKI